MFTYDMPLTIKAAHDEQKGTTTVEGMGSTTEVDVVGDVVEPGAFREAVASKVRMLWNHDPGQPIGTWEKLTVERDGLRVKGKVLHSVQRGREVAELLKAKAIDGLSIGFRIPRGGATYDEDRGVRVIHKVDLWEVSLVTFPANQSARVLGVRSMPTAGDISQLVHGCYPGLSRSEVEAVAKSAVASLTGRRYDDPEDNPETGALALSIRVRDLARRMRNV